MFAMSSPSPASQLDVEIAAGRPAVLRVVPGEATHHDPARWAGSHRHAVRSLVTSHGALVVRGLDLVDAGSVAAMARALADELMTEREGFAARQPLAPGVHSSSAWPANQPMCLHQELSYARRPPGLLLLACLRAPVSGGATPVADSTQVLRALPPELVNRFEREGWLLERTYGGDIGASVEEAFGTADRAAVERYCRDHDIAWEWLPDGLLRTSQRRRAVMSHPVTGRRCWFNQVAFLSEWTMDPEVREFLLDVHGPERLPFTTRYGDGDPIGADVVALLNDAWDAAATREPWRDGDLLLVDNIRCAHGRDAYEGDREVVVALADPVEAPR